MVSVRRNGERWPRSPPPIRNMRSLHVIYSLLNDKRNYFCIKNKIDPPLFVRFSMSLLPSNDVLVPLPRTAGGVFDRETGITRENGKDQFDPFFGLGAPRTTRSV